MVATAAGAGLALLLLVAVLIRVRGRRAAPGVVGRVLRWSAIAATVGIAVAVFPAMSSDGGSAVAALVGVPPAAAAAVGVADVTGRAVGFVTVVAALGLAAWGLLLGLGPGFCFALPAPVLGVAALTSVRPRDPVAPRA
ncbi:hypothetical protein ACIGNX_02035 [Actinosynnema sp. NPDC053489]|uniref:hypothetical protein n=1 Tax=Actinosynnema sp. NPDC053489 TaxID=3363916 RepID=UPI0037CB0DE7